MKTTQFASTLWQCSGARPLGSAPPGYRLPFDGRKIITDGPGMGCHGGHPDDCGGRNTPASSQGIDYDAAGDTPWQVLAVADGVVVNVINAVTGFGLVLRIKHNDGLISLYAHLSEALVREGDSVRQGQLVAYTGNTGNGQGHHLHFEVRENWTPDNVYSGQSVDIKGLPTTMWCPNYPPPPGPRPFQYSGYADGVQPPLPSPCPNDPLKTRGDKWKLEIWNNRDMNGPTVEQRYDGHGLNFAYDWGAGGPSRCTGADNFSVRFSRRLYFSTAGDCTFTTTTDDGVRLWVDGVLLIDQWRDQGPTPYRATRFLNAGYHDLRMDYYENGGGAFAALDIQPIGAYTAIR